MHDYWFSGVCDDCGALVQVRDAGTDSEFDYAWSCTNANCLRNIDHYTFDMDDPDWVITRGTTEGEL